MAYMGKLYVFRFTFPLVLLMASVNLYELVAQSNPCNLIVDAGPDITICLGTGGYLHSKVIASHGVNWMYKPATGLGCCGLDPFANPTQTTTYVLYGESQTDNFIVNGTMETGDISPATSDYNLYTDINAFAASTGGYMVFTWPQIWDKFKCSAIWPGFGTRLMAITPTGSGTNIWCTTKTVKPNTDYKLGFSTYGALTYPGPPPSIGMTLNGGLVLTVNVLSNCQPRGGNIIWNSGSNSSIDICLQNYGGIGPEYICAVDNIFMTEICYENDTVTVFVGDPLELKANTPDEISCINKKVTIDASASNGGPNTTYRWITGDGWILTDPKSLIIEVSAPGTYVLKASNPYCSKELWVVVKGSITPPDISTKTTDIDCKHPNGTVEAISNSKTPLFQWMGPNGYFSDKAKNSDIVEPGIYFVTVTDYYGCWSVDSLELKDTRIEIEAVIDGDLILNCSKDSFSLYASSLIKNPLYQWKGPNQFKKDNSNSIVIVNPGWYSLTTTSAEGCKEFDSVFVTDSRKPISVSIHADTLNCNQQEVLLRLVTDTTAKFKWSGPKGFGSTKYQPLVSDSGWYKVQIVTIDSCKQLDSVYVAKGNIPDIYISANDTITCDKPIIEISGGSKTLGTSIEWTTPSGLIKNHNNIQAFDSGFYILTVMDSNGCHVSKSIQLFKDVNKPVLSNYIDTLNCNKTSIILNPNSSDVRSYSWTGSNGFTSTDPDPIVFDGGIYSLTVIAHNGCSANSEVTVFADTLHPQLTTLDDTLNCFKPILKLNLTDSSPSNYSWTGPNNFNSTLRNPSINTSGIYIVTASLANGCASTEQVIIYSDFAKPILQVHDDTLTCKKDSIPLNASKDQTNAVVDWRGPNGFQSTNINSFITNPGNYQLIVTNPNGCKDTASLIVFQAIGKPDLSANNDTLNCAKLMANLVANSSRDSLNYFWTGPNGFNSSNKQIITTDAGIYQIKIITTDGCSNQLQVNVVEDTSKPDLLLIADTLNCLKTQTNLNFKSNTKLKSLQWTGPGNFSSTQQDPLITQGGNYTLNVTGENNCSEIKNISILQDTIRPTISVISDTINCIKKEIELVANVIPAKLIGEWTTSSQQKIKANSIKTQAGGDFTFDVIGDNQCVNSIQLVIPVDTISPDLRVKDDTINCYFPTVDLNAFSNTNGIQYQWSGPNNFVSSKATNLIQQAGIYLIKIIAPNGCIKFGDVAIRMDTTKPELITTADSIDCIHSEATLNSLSDGGFRIFTWLSDQNQVLSNSQIVKTKRSGTYFAEVLNPVNGCITKRTQLVIQDSFVITDLIIDPINPVCGNTIGSAQIVKIIGGHKNIKYSIDHKQSFTSNTNFNSLSIGNYTLYAIDDQHCEFQKDFEIVEIPFVETNLVPEITLTLGDSARLNLSIIPDIRLVKSIGWVPTTYLSCNHCEDPIVKPLVSTDYKVTVIDTNGCQSIQYIRIVVETPKVWVPNVFSPNGDNINDLLTIFGSKAEVTRINIFQIFDRWGNRVFENKNFQPGDPAKGWNGTYNDQKCNPGVYVYWAEVELIDGKKWILKGDVTLIR
jgi:gliding motility-associated-like protein